MKKRGVTQAMPPATRSCECCVHVVFVCRRTEFARRGCGQHLSAKLLEENHELDGMYAEVEMAELAKGENTHRECLERIVFYEKLGFRHVEGFFTPFTV